MSKSMGIIDDYCEDLKCVADRLYTRAKTEEDDATKRWFAGLGNRIDDAREAIIAASQELFRGSREDVIPGTNIPMPHSDSIPDDVMLGVVQTAQHAAAFVTSKAAASMGTPQAIGPWGDKEKLPDLVADVMTRYPNEDDTSSILHTCMIESRGSADPHAVLAEIRNQITASPQAQAKIAGSFAEEMALKYGARRKAEETE